MTTKEPGNDTFVCHHPAEHFLYVIPRLDRGIQNKIDWIQYIWPVGFSGLPDLGRAMTPLYVIIRLDIFSVIPRLDRGIQDKIDGTQLNKWPFDRMIQTPNGLIPY